MISNIMMLSIVAQTSIKELEKAAKNGDATAQLNLGLSYMDGTDGKQNDKKAFEWLLKAANQGKFEACIPIARMIDQNRISGFKQKELYGWLNRAADSDNSEILIKVADEFLRLSGDQSKVAEKSRNRARAFEIYDKANKLTTDTTLKKYIAAQYVSKNTVSKGIELYGEIAELGDAEAQFIYGKYYYDCKDYEKAYPWLKKSYEQGYTSAKDIYLRCENIHKQAQIAAEKREAEEKAKKIAKEKTLAELKDKLHDYVFTITVPFEDLAGSYNAFFNLHPLMTTEVVIFALEKGKVKYASMTGVDKDRLPRNPSRGELLQLHLLANRVSIESTTCKFDISEDGVFSFDFYKKVDDEMQRFTKHFKYDKQKDMLYDIDKELYLRKIPISEYK